MSAEGSGPVLPDLLAGRPPPPPDLRLPRGRTLRLGPRPVVLGVLNVTPDSFSDGGVHFRAEEAVEAGLRNASEGADALDVGGESTRPGAEDVPASEQLRRILPVIEGLRRSTDIPISVDTRLPEVGREALAAGADIINDVEALRRPGWTELLSGREDVPVVLMHLRGGPRDMQRMTHYPHGVMGEIVRFLHERLERLASAGIGRDRVILDPGIGFAKKAWHNLEVLRALPALGALGRPVLVGASRKFFLGKLLEGRGGEGSARARDPAGRDVATVAVHTVALLGGASVLRVHNVPWARDLADVWEGLLLHGAPQGTGGPAS